MEIGKPPGPKMAEAWFKKVTSPKKCFKPRYTGFVGMPDYDEDRDPYEEDEIYYGISYEDFGDRD